MLIFVTLATYTTVGVTFSELMWQQQRSGQQRCFDSLNFERYNRNIYFTLEKPVLPDLVQSGESTRKPRIGPKTACTQGKSQRGGLLAEQCLATLPLSVGHWPELLELLIWLLSGVSKLALRCL